MKTMTDLIRPDLAGDRFDGGALLTADELAVILKVPIKSTYTLRIPRVYVGKRRVRWRVEDVRNYIDACREGDR